MIPNATTITTSAPTASTATEIAAEMITTLLSATAAVSNFNIGSVVRAIIDAVAAVQAQLEQENEDDVSLGIINAPFQALNAQPTGAIGSTYLLTFTLGSKGTAQTIPAGFAVATSNNTLQWEVGSAFTISPGTFVSTTATCTSTGAATNVPANVITQILSPIANLTVTNPSAQPTVLGQNPETPQQVQAELSNAIAQLHRGDAASVEAGALTSQLVDTSGNPTEQVVNCLTVDYLTPGIAYCYVYNGIGAMSAALLTLTQDIVNGYTNAVGVVQTGYKSAGVQVIVEDIVETPINVTVTVTPVTGIDFSVVQPNVQQAITNFFATSLDIQSPLSIAQLVYAIMSANSVADAVVSIPATSLPAIPYISTPAAALVLTADSDTTTTLDAGTYTVGYTWINVWGETLVSPAATVTITASEAIAIGSLALPIGATGVNYYVSSAEGSTTIYLDISGTGNTVTITALPAGTVTPPSTSTAQIPGNIYVEGTVTIIQGM